VLVVQKPVQDIYTCALFMSFVMLTVFGGIQAVSVLEHSGLVRAGASPVIIAVDDMDTLDEDMLAAEGVSVKECEVVYHRASQGNVYLDGYPYSVADRGDAYGVKAMYASAEQDLDDMGDLYYTLYTCSGAAVIAEGYI
jgi:hypothetical protein